MLLSSSNRKYPPFPLLSYISVVVCLRCLLDHILLLIVFTFRENRVFVLIIIVQFMMSANNRIRFILKIVFVSLYITPSHYHRCANLSEDIELKKCLSDIFCRVCEIGHIISVIHYTIRGAVCFQFTYFLVMIERIYILCLIIIIKSEVWIITHCFRVRSWNNGVRCMSFCILTIINQGFHLTSQFYNFHDSTGYLSIKANSPYVTCSN